MQNKNVNKQQIELHLSRLVNTSFPRPMMEDNLMQKFGLSREQSKKLIEGYFGKTKGSSYYHALLG